MYMFTCLGHQDHIAHTVIIMQPVLSDRDQRALGSVMLHLAVYNINTILCDMG